MRRRLVDRRAQPRFEIVGDLWGTVETVLRLPLREVGLNGALIQSHIPLAVDSIHRIACDGEGGETSAQIRVRHVRKAIGADGEESYWIGVEFLARSPAMVEQIRQWMADGPQAEFPGV